MLVEAFAGVIVQGITGHTEEGCGLVAGSIRDGKNVPQLKATMWGNGNLSLSAIQASLRELCGGDGGGVNDPSKNLWFLLDKLPKADLIAFNTYPGMIYQTPSEIPCDYFTGIRACTARPLAFSGTGWQSAEAPAGRPVGEAQQAEYVGVFTALTADLNPEFSAWSYLYDPLDPAEPFNSMGLLRGDGTPRPAWHAWTADK